MFVHRSSNLEELVEHLHNVVSGPGLGLLEPETIVIQSAGMERYLSRELSRKSGIVANVQFPFPRSFFLRILDAALGEDPRARAFERQSLSWILYSRLSHHVRINTPAFAEVAAYLDDDADHSKRLLLAERLAHLFDQYVTYRPKMVLDWQGGEDEQDFQAILWRELCDQLGQAHFAARCHRFLYEMSDDELKLALPSRLCLVGGPGLPPLFLQMFARIGKVVPCHLFSFSVCKEYFADAHPLGEELPDVGEGLHPLLISMGKVGADYQHLLEMIGDYEDGGARFLPGPKTTVLGALQQALIEGRVEIPGGEATREHLLAGLDQDRSITVDSCHSPLREVEVLHDRLLGWFSADPTLRPEDVVVLAPQIEEYSPLISAVFSARAGERPKIPFRIADRSEKFTNSAARAFLLAFSLLRGRFKASEVLDLIQLAPVRARLDIEGADLERISRWVTDAGVRWGADGEHKAEYGVPDDDKNSWRFGLRRLLLGFALPDDGEQLFRDVVPLDEIAVGDLELVGKLCAFCDSLFSLRKRLSQAGAAGMTPSGWSLFLTDLIDALLGEPQVEKESTEDTWDTGAVRNVVFELLERAEQGLSLVPGEREDQRVGPRGLYHVLSTELENSRPSTDFLAGGVTFCALLPLRTIPFRAVCVLGLNQGRFPRTDQHYQLDLMARDPKRGDRSLRADDRYLFLEVILAARQRLCLSYVGRGVQDNTEVPPSVVVTELSTVIEEMLGKDDARAPFLTPTEHPLQPFHADYFAKVKVKRGRSELSSFDKDMFQAAEALRREKSDTRPFFSEGASISFDEEEVELTLDQLVRFWKGPSQAFFEAHGVRFFDDLEEVEDREPVVETGLDRFIVGDRLLENKLRERPIRPEIELLRGNLPVGAGGRAVLESVERFSEQIFRRAAEFRKADRLPPQPIALRLSSPHLGPTFGVPLARSLPRILLTGVIDDVFGDVRLTTSFGQLNTNRKVALWLTHLAACAAGVPIEKSVLIVRAEARSGALVDTFAVRSIEQDAATKLLGRLCGWALCGQKHPLPFFPAVSEKYFETLHNPPKRLGEDEVVPYAFGVAKAALVPKGGGARPDAIVAELYRGTDPLGVETDAGEAAVDDLGELPFALLAEAFFGPLGRAVVALDKGGVA